MSQQKNIPTDIFSIYTDRLAEGKEEVFSFAADSTFLEVEEEELSYTGDVQIDGKAYLAGHELIIHIDSEAQAVIPCAICNAPVVVPIAIKKLCLAIPAEEFTSGIFSFRGPLRESIILETPRYVECGGNCPQRALMARYLKQEKDTGKDEGETYHPFADLKL
jgi:uncharacterized metal-binding protein YceD (DUF177 family)